MAEKRVLVASNLTEDISSSRLAILSELMDARKRAEQQEQEFLKKIHRENAGLSSLIGLFEEGLADVKTSVSDQTNSLSEFKSHFDKRLLDLTASIESLSVADSAFTEELKGVTSEVVAIRNAVSSVSAEALQRQEQAETRLFEKIDYLHVSLNSTISELGYLCKRVADIEELQKSSQSFQVDIVDRMTKAEKGILDAKENLEICKLSDLEIIQNRLLALERGEEVQNKLENIEKSVSSLESVSSGLAEKFRAHRDLIVEEISLMKRSDELRFKSFYNEIQKSVNNQQTRVSHFWRIPINRLQTDSDPIDSEIFSLDGKLSDCFFRYFHTNGILWLVWRPGREDDHSILVDLIVGKTKKGPINKIRKEEFYNCWIWEAQGLRWESEIYSSSVTIGVEVVQPLGGVSVDDLGETGELNDTDSVFSFSADRGREQPVLSPLLEISEPPRAVTPRRANWTQFGVSRNPFG